MKVYANEGQVHNSEKRTSSETIIFDEDNEIDEDKPFHPRLDFPTTETGPLEVSVLA